MGSCFLYKISAGGRSSGYRMTNFYGGWNPPASGVYENDIFIRTNVPLLRGVLTTNVGGIPAWTDQDGVCLITLTSGAFSDTNQPVYFTHNTETGAQEFFDISGFPGQAYVYESGWRLADGYIFHNNTWTQFSSTWDGTLFYNGDQYVSITGGWTGADSYSPNLTATLYVGTITISTASAVDLSGFSTLKFTGSGNGANSGGTYGADCKIVNESGAQVASAGFQSNGTHTVNVATLSGKHYIRFSANGSRGNNLNISKVWLEK